MSRWGASIRASGVVHHYFLLRELVTVSITRLSLLVSTKRIRRGAECVQMAATDTRRRVKVYSFNEKMQWEDMGTGHVSVNYVERLQSLIIMVRSEEDGELMPLGK